LPLRRPFRRVATCVSADWTILAPNLSDFPLGLISSGDLWDCPDRYFDRIEVHLLRDAIVYLGWSWETFNVPERMALALAHLGSKVLYVENPTSMVQAKCVNEMRSITDRIFAFRPVFLGHRFQTLPLFPMFQAEKVTRQIAHYPDRLALHEALFFYPYMGTLWCVPVEMKKEGISSFGCSLTNRN